MHTDGLAIESTDIIVDNTEKKECILCGFTALREGGKVFDLTESWCCGYCRPSRCSNGKFLTILVSVLSLVTAFFFSILFIGVTVENDNVRRAPSTLWFYSTPEVCGFSNEKFATYSNSTLAHSTGAKIAQCGSCGACSTVEDIGIYSATRNTLTKTATACGTKAFLGRKQVEVCYKTVGFTPACSECWVENVMCDYSSCVYTCLKMLIFSERNNNVNSGGLNDCLNCDEKLCGPDFIRCAGANRRRSGIVSDIVRDNAAEVCHVVDSDWWN